MGFCVCVCALRPPPHLSNYITKQSTAIVMEMEPIDVQRVFVYNLCVYVCVWHLLESKNKKKHESKSGHLVSTQNHFIVKSLPVWMSCIMNFVVLLSVVRWCVCSMWCGLVYSVCVLHYWQRDIAMQLWYTVFIMSARNMQTVHVTVRGSICVSIWVGWLNLFIRQSINI